MASIPSRTPWRSLLHESRNTCTGPGGRVESDASPTAGAKATNPMPVDLRTELVEIRRELLAMGALVEERVGLVFAAMEKGDVEAAARIRDGDTDVDRLEVRMEEHCMRLLALAQPVAGDLRFILTVLRVNGELERIADLAKGIAKRVIRLGKQWHVSVPEIVVEMGRESRAMLSEVLTALSTQDAAKCRGLTPREDRVDTLQKQVVGWVREEVARSPEHAPAVIDVLTLAQRVERMADIITNIAEDVVFLVEGRVVRHGGL